MVNNRPSIEGGKCFSMRTKDMMLLAVAVMMLAVVGFVAVTDGNDADEAMALDGAIVINADGTMSVTTQGEVEVDKAQMLALDLTDSFYIIPTAGMTTDLTIATLAYYEAVKPYLTLAGDSEVFKISIEEVAAIGSAEWQALKVGLSKLDVDVTKITTTITTMSPVAVAEAGEQAVAEAVAKVTEEKDAIIATMLTQEQMDAQIAEAVAAATAGLYTQEQVDQAVADALANVSDYQYTQTDLDKAVDAAVAGVYAKYLTSEQIKAVQDSIDAKALDIKKAVARMDMTEEEGAKALADYTIQAYKDAFASETAAAKDKTIADLNAQIADLNAKLADATKTVPEKPIYETGMGQCMIIIVVFLLALVVWFLYKQGTFVKLAGKISKKKGGSE